MSQLGPAAPNHSQLLPEWEDRAKLPAVSNCWGQFSPLVLHVHLEAVWCQQAEAEPPPGALQRFNATTFPPPAFTATEQRRGPDLAARRLYGRERTAAATYLYPVLRQLRLHSQHLPGIDVGVVRFIESLLQLLQLVSCEYRPAERREHSVTPSGPLANSEAGSAPQAEVFLQKNPPPTPAAALLFPPFPPFIPLGDTDRPSPRIRGTAGGWWQQRGDENGDSLAPGRYLCRRFFLLIWELDIFKSLASPDRLSSSGSNMREGKSHVPVESGTTEPSSPNSVAAGRGQRARGGVPSHGRAPGAAPVMPSRGRGWEPALAGGSKARHPGGTGQHGSR